MTNTCSVWKRWNKWVPAIAGMLLLGCGTAHLIDVQKARHEHTNEILSYEEGPLSRDDLPYLRYFETDDNFRIRTDVRVFDIPDTVVIPTYSGKKKNFLKWGEALFTFGNKECSLLLFQNVKYLPKDPDHLFIPFKDATSGEATYGGGRYLDLDLQNLKNGRLTIDFNLAYNPWCAYSDGFNCPIPPTANHLDVLIEAGERNYAKH